MGAGRPPAYKTAKEMQDKIDNYLANPPMLKKYITKDLAINVAVPTITGLALHLGFASRQSMYDYENKEQFAYTIKTARLHLEKHYEEQLQVGNTTGAIFALKNFGWIDKSEHDHTTNGKDINIPPIEWVNKKK